MRVLSLFSGGGLGDYGLELAGHEIVGQVEIEEYCQKILSLRWPHVPKWRDVRAVHARESCPMVPNAEHDGCTTAKVRGSVETSSYRRKKRQTETSESQGGNQSEGLRNLSGGKCENCLNIGTVDLISGGFPCQDISTAGKGAGIKGERSGLWKEMLRIIREVRPRYVLVENVTALRGRGLGVVLGDLAESGYDAEWDCIPASAVGAPHQRDRIWIVAHSSRSGAGGKVSEVNRPDGRRKFQEKINKDNNSDGFKRPGKKSETLAHPSSGRYQLSQEKIFAGRNGFKHSSWWAVEPRMGGSSDGPPLWLVRRHIGKGVSVEEQKRAIENLPKLWNKVISETLWKAIGGLDRFQKAEILFAVMREYEKNPNKTRLLMESEKALKNFLRGMRVEEAVASTSRRPKSSKQRPKKYPDSLQTVSRLLAHDLPKDWSEPGWEDGVSRETHGIANRVDRLKLLGNGQVCQVVEWIGNQIIKFDKARLEYDKIKS